MKIIHAADIHLGSALKSRFPEGVSEKIRDGVKGTFARLADYAADNGIPVVMLSGDVFDSDTPSKVEKDYFYSVVRLHPSVDFLYLRGNHDGGSGYEGMPIDNLKTFSKEWTTYSYGNIDITGIEISEENRESLYSTLCLDPSRYNIVMMHGPIKGPVQKDFIYLNSLKNKGINYLALGHIHKGENGRLDERGIYVYPGCLEGRGFDETGSHGFVLLDVADRVKCDFIPFASREICELDVDVTGAGDSYAAAAIVKDKGKDIFNRNNIYIINITGEVDLDATIDAAEVEKALNGVGLYVNVKDKTKRRFDASIYEKDTGLKGEFVRGVMRSDLDENTKMAVLKCGLQALNGEDIEF